MGKRRFICNNCRLSWTINKIRGVDYNQECQNCNSRHVWTCGIKRRKRQFQCADCKKWWSVPVIDLIIKRSDNDLRYVNTNVEVVEEMT